jgi:hypothetical protein
MFCDHSSMVPDHYVICNVSLTFATLSQCSLTIPDIFDNSQHLRLSASFAHTLLIPQTLLSLIIALLLTTPLPFLNTDTSISSHTASEHAPKSLVKDTPLVRDIWRLVHFSFILILPDYLYLVVLMILTLAYVLSYLQVPAS